MQPSVSINSVPQVAVNEVVYTCIYYLSILIVIVPDSLYAVDVVPDSLPEVGRVHVLLIANTVKRRGREGRVGEERERERERGNRTERG